MTLSIYFYYPLPRNTYRRVCCLYAEHLYKQPPLQPRPSVRLLPTFTWWTPPVPSVSLRVKASSWMMSWRLAAEGLLATDVVWRRSRRRLPGPTTHHTKHTNRLDTLFKGTDVNSLNCTIGMCPNMKLIFLCENFTRPFFVLLKSNFQIDMRANPLIDAQGCPSACKIIRSPISQP